ncbi:phosphoglycerate kinase [Candidatus Cryosericum hinesii]|jgi:phosphoglycerate kinase|uniref:Phosphoglycerate kinase n=1 Tax=Candidatus Cryosericum hinesii TaxID=2290915 RepID=A0A398DFY6_9BACT|nr:phosphoglycerate kinase [Candidatus Cryosericum hinesii]RIE09896.1 phosphoglycerate kinase [Candidatus Cryosericum hinesii]RIE14035.1 phosphoglycerate kinase [Candidatus Cryosericum hinesii]RIE15050.1 phosphoglycerate kinase [Candidatus Cryosericum hinesii]
MTKRSIRDLDVQNKRVLLRVDYNVPMSKDGAITDDKRILETLPTIRYLLDKNATIILVTHMGRPDGKIVESLRLDKIAQRLSALLGKPVNKLNSVVGPDVTEAVANAKPGDIIMLENVRFLKEEKNGSEELAKKLAALADVYVDDAFATAHRPDTSVAGVPQFLPSAAGFLLEKEIDVLETVTTSAKKPFIAILGGAKVSDKIGLIKNLLTKTDAILIGGGMAFTFLKAMGYAIGFSLVEEDYLKVADEIIEAAKAKGTRLLLPVDVIVTNEIKAGSSHHIVDIEEIPADQIGVDIGPKTIEAFEAEIAKANTIIWNGPMGVIEIAEFAEGTKSLARVIAARSDALTVAGGGETASVIDALNLQNDFKHVSTGGGAFLEYLEGKQLPGIEAIDSAD